VFGHSIYTKESFYKVRMSYRNALLRLPKVNNAVVPDEENAKVNNLVINTNKNINTNTNWLSKIQINIPPEREPFRNVDFPSPLPTTSFNNSIYDNLPPKPELTEDQQRLVQEDPAAYLFLPPSLYIRDVPYYIYSQHYGECATDSFLNILFFADGYRQYFGKLADTLYKRLRMEHRYDLLHYTPYFKKEVQRLYQIQNVESLDPPDFDSLVDIFARIVRRFIFVMLLNQTGYTTADKLSEIIEQTCPLRVKKTAVRRKSINAMAGIDIHDAILEYLGDIRREKKKNSNELVTRGLSTYAIHTILSWFMKTILAPRARRLTYQRLPFETTEAIQPSLPLLKAVYLTGSPKQEEKVGHAVALFCHTKKWYLADNNLGIPLPLEDFDPSKYFGPGVLSQFFMIDFQGVRVTELLRGNHDVKVAGFDFDDVRYNRYTIERLQRGTFYGFYIYTDGDKNEGANQIVIAISRENSFPCEELKEQFDQDQRIYFFADESIPLGNEAQVNELHANLPSPFKRSKLKKTKRRPRSKGKRRTTQRAKPVRANQTRGLEEEVNNVENALNNAASEYMNENMARYFNKGNQPQKMTLGNFL
jgi:hypothetical protein